MPIAPPSTFTSLSPTEGQGYTKGGGHLLYSSLLDSANDSQTRAHLLAIKHKETGAWLSDLLVASLGLCLDNEAVYTYIVLPTDLS